MNSSTPHGLNEWLRRIALRVRLRRGIRNALGAVIIAGMAAILLGVVARLTPLGWERWAASGLVVLAASAGLLTGVARRLPRQLLARSADRDLAASDRIVTTLEVGRGSGSRPVEQELVWSTLRWLRGQPAKLAAPLRLPRRRGVAALAVVGVLGLVLLLPNPMDEAVAQRKEDAGILESKALELKREAAKVKANDAIPPETRNQIAKELERAAAALEESASIEEGLAALARSEGKLAGLARRDALASKALLRSFERSLEEKPLAPGLKGNAPEQVRSLAGAEATPQEKQEAADRLDQLAGSLESTDSQLSGDLAEAAEGLRSGDDSSLEQAADALERAASEIEGDRALGEARSEIADARSGLNEATKASQGGGPQGQPGGNQPSEGAQGNQGAQGDQGGPGGQGNQAGNPSGQVGGTNAPTGSPATGGPGAPNGSGNNPSAGIGDSPVFDPILGGEISERLQAEGQRQAGGRQTLEGSQTGLGQEGDVQIPYRYVYPAWSSRAARTIEVTPVPASVRSFVRSYFTALAPAPTP